MLNGKEIKNKRKSMGWSAETLADLLKVSKDNIYKWEKGHVPSNPEDYLKIEKWLKSGKVESVPEKSIVSDSEAIYGHDPKDKEKIISLLERENERLRNDLATSLVELEARTKVIAAVQSAIMEILLTSISDRKVVYNKSVEILKKYKLEGSFL